MRRFVVLLFAIPLCNQVFGYSTDAGKCVHRLRNIDLAKKIIAEEKGLKPGDAVTSLDLREYWNSETTKCPRNGEYTVGVIGTGAKCSIPDHTQGVWDKQLARFKRQRRIEGTLQLVAWLAMVVGPIVGGVLLLRWKRSEPRIDVGGTG